MKAGGGYMDGNKIRLGNLALWKDRSVAEKGVWVYQGIGNSVTEQELLIFNEHTKKIAVINVQEMSSNTYQCSVTP